MKRPITKFRNLKIALKELKPFIRNGEHLKTGKPLPGLGLRTYQNRLFFQIYVISLHSAENGNYIYNIALLDICKNNVPVLQVSISKNFDSWIVHIIQ